MDSILTSVKKLLGIAEECEDFDADIVMYLNSVFMVLTQMGVGPKEGFAITGKEERWSQFIADPVKAAAVKAYAASARTPAVKRNVRTQHTREMRG